MNSYIPWVVCGAAVLLALWWTGRLSLGSWLVSRMRTSGTDRPAPILTQIEAEVITDAASLLDTLDSHALGLAFQQAVRREADVEISKAIAAHNQQIAINAETAKTQAAVDRVAAIKEYVDPFVTGTGTRSPPAASAPTP